MAFAGQASLHDTEEAAEAQAKYADSPRGFYQTAAIAPSILEGDVLSSNTVVSPVYLSEAMSTTGSPRTRAKHATTAPGDTAILSVLWRASRQDKVDFSRIILMRAAWTYDGGPIIDMPPQLPSTANYAGMQSALQNLQRTSAKIIDAILADWASRFEQGIRPTNNIGPIPGSH